MAVATYHRDADGLDHVRLTLTSPSDVQVAVRSVLGIRTSVGHPTLEVQRDDGSALSLSTDGQWALLVRIDTDGISQTSVRAGQQGSAFVFDHKGSWSEASSENTVHLGLAVQALTEFVQRGVVPAELVAFQPD